MTDRCVSSDDTLTRRQLRERSRSSKRRAPAGQWLGRVAVLGALALTTSVIPATGVAFPHAEPGPTATVTLADSSALDVLGAGHADVAEGPGLASLQAVAHAQGRSTLSASRDGDERRVPECDAPGMAANGSLAAEVDPTEIDLVRPLPEGSYRSTSPYGYRTHPIFGRYAEHTGWDLAAPTGTPIHAIADGVVTHAGGGRDGRSGQLIIIEHEIDGAPVWSWYVHMYPNGVYVGVGQEVSAGEEIGAVGSYGYSTGPHLHLEIHIDDQLTTVDPQAWLAQREAAPLNAETMACAGP